ncbi:transport protein [Legionella lansingensis]|uniref:Transport protein n=1 Tax=Legionella lansingensis TaxID=45067 RepID=A0A0W0VPV2_9GAMM|nr:DMT family transporter [Legionella lansingensis]KTD22167.1 transport protein [Legionella lansingensis]SNV54639.1 transport protein [Legionella lansingensis]
MWLIFAIVAAVLWGLNYSLAEKVLRSISPITLLALEMLLGAIVFSLLSYFTTFKKDLDILLHQPSVFWLTSLEVVIVIVASFFIVYSIQLKDATFAGTIELTYPLFIILFTWLLFGENHVDTSVIVGGIFIFIGVLFISIR